MQMLLLLSLCYCQNQLYGFYVRLLTMSIMWNKTVQTSRTFLNRSWQISITITKRKIKMTELSWANSVCRTEKKQKQNLLPHNGTLSDFFCYEEKGLACLQDLYHQCVWTDRNMKITACKEAVAQSSTLYVCGKLFIWVLHSTSQRRMWSIPN